MTTLTIADLDNPATAIAVIRESGRTVRRLAADINVHRTTIYRWARGITRPASRLHATRLFNLAVTAYRANAKAEAARRAAAIPLVWRTTRRGERVVYGPAATIAAGGTVTVNGTTVAVDRLGRPFNVDDVDMVYGYTTQPQPRRASNNRCACGCGGWLSAFDRKASAVAFFKFDCA